MALNLQTFKTRTLTAIIFAAVMLVGLLWNGWSFIILFTIIHFGCWYEFVKLIRKIRPKDYGYYVSLGVLYITFPVLMMLDMSLPFFDSEYNSNFPQIIKYYSWIFPCVIIFSIWINDTMAYIVGSFIGKTPFSNISPKKTWEGTIGGAVLCVAVISIAGWLILREVKVFAIISLLCAVFGTLGDLLESKLKRMAGVKDSGSLMPGHGGFLDRFDSLLIAVPFVWLYVYLFIR
jgi:phosphatidate cytidylyltransferase